MPAPPVDPAKAREAVRLVREEGKSQTAAGKAVGISQGSVSNLLRFGITERKAEEAPAEIPADATHDFVEIPVVHRDYTHMDRLYVYPLGDVHIGAPAHDRAKWEEWLGYLASRKDVSIIGTGDFLNSAIKTSVSDVYEEKSPVGEAKRLLWKHLEPIKDRIDVLIPGNHEDRIWKAVGDCPIRDVADFLGGVPYARDAVMIVYHVGQVEYHVYVRHGTGGGDVGGRATRLAKQARTCLADVYISGHTHHRLAFPEEILGYDPVSDKVTRRDRYFVSSGSFLRLESYAVKSGYAPTKLGAPRLFFDGTARDIHVSV